jgi:hypothetical protein
MANVLEQQKYFRDVVVPAAIEMVSLEECPTQVLPWDSPKYDKAIKKDSDKPRFDLVDQEWLEEVAKAMTNGARKYDDHNWRKGFKFSRLIAAAFRHLNALAKGENDDPETGLSHAAHLACCSMFVYWHILHKPDLDDRWKND